MYLVRHAAVVVDRAVPSHRRQLSPEGRRAAALLELPAGRALTSSEDRARETARLAGLDATPDDRLREVTRPWSDDYEADVRRYLTGAAVSGWEPREAVLARLHAALDGFDGFAVTHGLAIALHGDMTFDEWRAMPFPAVIER
jgi:broad specificity phosphatase PhoE